METLDKLKDILQAEVVFPRWAVDNPYKKLYLKSSFGRIENGFVFMNLTQKEFFYKFLKNKLKKPLLDRNTYFYIIN